MVLGVVMFWAGLGSCSARGWTFYDMGLKFVIKIIIMKKKIKFYVGRIRNSLNNDCHQNQAKIKKNKEQIRTALLYSNFHQNLSVIFVIER